MRTLLVILLAVLMAGCVPAPPVPPSPRPSPYKLRKAKPKPQAVEVLDFWATWCGPCLANRPAILALQAEGYKITEIDIDKHPAKKVRWNITAVPTYIVLVKGKVTLRTSSASELRTYLHDQHPLKKAQPKTNPGPNQNPNVWYERVPPIDRPINHQLR